MARRYKIFRRAKDPQSMDAQMIADNRQVIRGGYLKKGGGVWAQTRFNHLDDKFHVTTSNIPYTKYPMRNAESDGMRAEVNSLGGRNRVEGSMTHKDRWSILRQTFGLSVG